MLQKLTGRLDMDSCGELARTLTSVLRQSPALELDLSDVTAVDSAALALILELQREAVSQGHTLALTHTPTGLESLARLYGIEALLSSSGDAEQ